MKYLAFLLLLSGCATNDVYQEDFKLYPPSSAMVECNKLEPLKDRTVYSLVEKLSEVSSEYKDCAKKHGELIDFIQSHRDRQ